MADEIKKYKISDPEGAELFLSVNDKRFIDANAEELLLKKKNRQKQIRNIIIITSSVFVAIVFLFVYAIDSFKEERKENLSVNEIISSVNSMRDQINIASVSKDEFHNNLILADSLLLKIDNLIKEYPKEDTLKSLWAVVAMHKYEQKIFDIVRHDRFDANTKIDSVVNLKVQEYYPQLLSVVPVLESLVDFNKFSEMYPDPPRVASAPPKQFFVEELLKKTELIEDTLKTAGTLIEVEFPVVYTWISYLSNTIVPDIKDWSRFWTTYQAILQKGEDDPDSQKQLKLLRQEFPSLAMINDSQNNMIGEGRNLIIGVFANSIIPVGSNMERQWYPILKYINDKTGFEFSIQEFDSELKLLKSLQNADIDFAVLGAMYSTIADYSKVGIPIAQRMWDSKNVIANYVVSFDKKKTNPDFVSNEFALLSPEEFSLLEYFDQVKINTDSCCGKIHHLNSVDSIATFIKENKYDYYVLSDEDLYYLQNANKKDPNIILELNKTPLSVMWAREGLDYEIIKSLISVLIPMSYSEISPEIDPRDLTFGDWDLFEKNLMKNYMSDIKSLLMKYNKVLNQIILSAVNTHDDDLKEDLSEAISNYFSKIGFSVIQNSSTRKVYEDEFKRIVEISTKSLKDDEIEYKVDVLQHFGKGKKNKLLYSMVFSDEMESFPPNFKRKLNDVIAYIPIYGRITKVEGDIADFELSVEPANVINKTVFLYKVDFEGNIKNEYYGKAKVISEENKVIKLKIDEHLKNIINSGDIGEIKNN